MADITVIGGINIDIEGRPFAPLLYRDSNPGRIVLSYGGVGRNIAENIARTGGHVAMISVIGEDPIGEGARRELEALGVDISGIEKIPGVSTAMYLSILNDRRDMELALCDMEILSYLTAEKILSHSAQLRQSKVVALDGNLEEPLLERITESLDGIRLFFDPVSASKAVKGKKHIGRFFAVKPNRLEAETLTGIRIRDEKDLRRAADCFLEQGVRQVYITLSQEGVFYKDRQQEGILRPVRGEVVSATGAGDSFSAMILQGIAENFDIERTARMGMAAASITMESQSAVNQKICREEIIRRMQDV